MCILRRIETYRGNAEASSKWVAAQLNVGIICACLPTLGPALPSSDHVKEVFRDLLASLRPISGSSAKRNWPILNDDGERLALGMGKSDCRGCSGDDGSDRTRSPGVPV